jgi:N-acylneuraminate cytidylyltransferase
MNIAVIPARGGSKRIPRKNIKLFHGQPVIAYAIKAAQESEVFDEVIVSTDDDEIAEVARIYGAKIPWMRAKSLSDDHTTTISVMQDAVEKLKSSVSNLGNICCIYPVTPLLQPRFLVEGLKILEDSEWNYVFSGLRASAHPQRFFSLGDSEGVEMLFPKFELTRTQDLGRYFSDAGQFYWGKKSAWESGRPIFSSESTILEIPTGLAVDIDTLEDWHQAERLFELKEEI